MHAWKVVDGPHYHRGSINPELFSAAEMRMEEVEESSKDQFKTAAAAMNVISLLNAWSSRTIDGWSVKSSTVRAGAVKLFPTDPTIDDHTVIYFPKACRGGCNSHIEGEFVGIKG